MITQVNSSRLMKYHQAARQAAPAAAPASFGQDTLVRAAGPSLPPAPSRSALGLPAWLVPSTPALVPAAPAADASLAGVRASVEGLIRVLNMMPAQQLNALYERFDLRNNGDIATASRELGVAIPQDANGLMRLLGSLRPDQLDGLIRRFKLDTNPDVLRYGPMIQTMTPEAVAGLLGMVKIKPKKPAPPPTDPVADRAFVTDLYRELLGREPDAEGLTAHVSGLAGGTTREQLRQIFLDSAEYKEKQARPAAPPPAPAPPPGPKLPAYALPALPTVPVTEEFANAPIDRSSPDAAIMSAARWVKDAYPQLFTQGDDRPLAYKMMAKVIGALRAHGFDAYRIVNHHSRPVGDPGRYGSDALVHNGNVYDVYASLGEANRPQVLNHGPMSPNQSKE